MAVSLCSVITDIQYFIKTKKKFTEDNSSGNYKSGNDHKSYYKKCQCAKQKKLSIQTLRSHGPCGLGMTVHLRFSCKHRKVKAQLLH